MAPMSPRWLAILSRSIIIALMKLALSAGTTPEAASAAMQKAAEWATVESPETLPESFTASIQPRASNLFSMPLCT